MARTDDARVPRGRRLGCSRGEPGEPGDRHYIIVSGSARVLRDGVEVALLGPGERFGEIALQRPGPRRATLQPESSLELLALERKPCLLAVTGSTANFEAVDRTTDTLLAPDELDDGDAVDAG